MTFIESGPAAFVIALIGWARGDRSQARPCLSDLRRTMDVTGDDHGRGLAEWDTGCKKVKTVVLVL